MKALQGTWDVVALEVDGSKMDAGSVGGSQIILKGDTFSTVSMGAAYSGTFTVDATRTPHTLDITFTDGPHTGQKSLGIFTLDGDTWTLCLGMAGTSRPKKFVTTPGSGHALETLTRSTSEKEPVQPLEVNAGKRAGRSVANSQASNTSGAPVAVSKAMAEHGGDWSMVSLDQSGQPMIPAAYVRFGRREVHGNEIKVTMNGQVMLDVTFSVDTSTTPRSIDYTLVAGANKGKTQLGIYELKGDTARYCMSAPGNDRPAEFKTEPGDGRTLSVWKKGAK